jgi:3,4-dihydroxy-2-butanone 4-phosphate synthase/2-C-methyl-D-erythritol 4-phosphate cytidylyltransferase
MNYALILAGGVGSRMKSDLPKQYLELEGKPILAHALSPFEESPLIKKIILVVEERMTNYCKDKIIDKYGFKKIQLVTGGELRQESVFNGIMAITEKDCDYLIIHDAARPLIKKMDIEKLIRSKKNCDGVAPIIPLADDIVRSDNGLLTEVLSREGLYSMQTPMIFKFDKLKKAHLNARKDRFKATEDAKLILREQGKIRLIEGSPYYYKIVFPQDLEIIGRLLNKQIVENDTFVSVEEAIEEFRKGKPVIISDSEDRENEGDLCIPSELVTPEIINLMVTYCKGIVCTCITKDKAKKLKLNLMSKNNNLALPAFTITVDALAKFGVVSGTSAFDRASTILALINDKAKPSDFRSPGHVFPLIANPGGLKIRRGHTEATITLAKIGGFSLSTTICEVLSEDGTMARMPQLIAFAKNHNLKITTIDKIIRYAKQHDIFY